MTTSTAEPTATKTKPRHPLRRWIILALVLAFTAVAIPIARFSYEQFIPRNTFESAIYKVRSGTKNHTFQGYDCGATDTDDIYGGNWSFDCYSQTSNSRFTADSPYIFGVPRRLKMWTYDTYGDTSVKVTLTYHRFSRTLEEEVDVYLDRFHAHNLADDPAAVLAQLGVTNDDLKHKRDKILYETILPTILGKPVTEKDLQDINTTTDQFLS
jgi:hypothetical protein